MGLFGWGKKSSNAASGPPIFAFTFKIASGTTAIPPPMIGAWVTAYATGEDSTSAAERAWQKLRAMGYVVEDMNPTGHTFPLSRWNAHIAETWPEFVSEFPDQQSLPRALATSDAVLSPFAGFERET